MATPGTVTARYLDILTFPLDHPEFVPSLIPLFLGLFIMQLYFGRYRYEELGWNSAVSNAVLLITTGISLVLQLGLQPFASGPRSVVAYGIVVTGLIILLLNFYHIWPAEIAFNVSSAFTSYTLAYLAIAIAYKGLPLTDDTLTAAAAFFITLNLFTRGLKRLSATELPRDVNEDDLF